jgi:hypothetical protein
MSTRFGIDGEQYWLKPTEIDQYHNDGYLTLTGVLTDFELAGLEPIFNQFIQGRVPGMGRDFCDMSGPYSRKFKEFSLVNVVLPRHYRPALKDNIYERCCASIACQLIGNSATLDYDQFLAKRPAKPDAGIQVASGLGVLAKRYSRYDHSDVLIGSWTTPTPRTAVSQSSHAHRRLLCVRTWC